MIEHTIFARWNTILSDQNACLLSYNQKWKLHLDKWMQLWSWKLNIMAVYKDLNTVWAWKKDIEKDIKEDESR